MLAIFFLAVTYKPFTGNAWGKCCEHFHSGIGSPLSMFKGAMALRSRSFELIWKSFFIYIFIYIYIHSRRILILYVLIILCNFRCRFSLVFWWASLLSNPISFFFIFPEKTSTVAEVVMGPMIESSRMSWSWFWEGIYFLSFPTGFWNMITRRKPNAMYIIYIYIHIIIYIDSTYSPNFWISINIYVWNSRCQNAFNIHV